MIDRFRRKPPLARLHHRAHDAAAHLVEKSPAFENEGDLRPAAADLAAGQRADRILQDPAAVRSKGAEVAPPDETAAYGASGTVPRVPFFRFPGFASTPELLAYLDRSGIAVFGADFWASDWSKMTPEQELDLVLKRLDAAGGGIVLFHDTKAQTAAMIPAFLRALKEKGYKVVHIVPAQQHAAR